MFKLPWVAGEVVVLVLLALLKSSLRVMMVKKDK
jgi:hypothetical protein